MSWNFANASNEWLTAPMPNGLQPPFWVSAWVNATWAVDSTIWSTANGSGSVDYHYLYVRSFNNAGIGSRDSGASVAVNTSTTLTDGVWHHVLGVWRAANDRRVYLDAGGVGSNTTSVSPAGLNRMGLGATIRSSPFWYMDGNIAEVAVGRGVLSHSQRAELAGGVSPLSMGLARDLVAYWILEEPGDLGDRVSNKHLTIGNGTPTHDYRQPQVQPPQWPGLVSPGIPKRYLVRAL